MSKIPQVRFNLKTNAGTDQSLIFLIFRYNDNRLKYSTGLYVNPKHWDSKRLRARNTRGKENEYTTLNKTLSSISDLVIQVHHKNENISLSEFKTILDFEIKGIAPKTEATRNKPSNFIDFIDVYINEQKMNPAAKRGTWKILQTNFNHLKSYCKKYGYYDRDKDFITFTYGDLDKTWRNDFVNRYLFKEKNHSMQYAHKVMTVINQFINAANDRDLPEYWGYKKQFLKHKSKGWLPKNPKTTKFRLTFEELAKLYELKLSGIQENVRDLFLIGSYTGLRFGDFSRLKPHHIIEEDEIKMIELTTEKTSDPVTIPLIGDLEAILEKYNFEIPHITINEFNRVIKDVAALANIDKTIVKTVTNGGITKEVKFAAHQLIASHVARRSFCSNFYELGIPAIQLMKISTHSTEKQFFNYICIDNRYNAKEFAKEVKMKMDQRTKLRVVS